MGRCLKPPVAEVRARARVGFGPRRARPGGGGRSNGPPAEGGRRPLRVGLEVHAPFVNHVPFSSFVRDVACRPSVHPRASWRSFRRPFWAEPSLSGRAGPGTLDLKGCMRPPGWGTDCARALFLLANLTAALALPGNRLGWRGH